MTEASLKKSRERLWVDRLREASRLVFEIDDDREVQERPDFLLRHEGRAIGLEVVELQVDQGRGAGRGSDLKRSISIRRHIVSLAQENYLAAPSSRINVQFYFQSSCDQSLSRFRSKEFREIAENISKVLCKLKVVPFENIRLDQDSDPSVSKPFGFVHVCGIPDPIRPRWQVVNPGWSVELKPSDLEPILRMKNDRLRDYRKTVNENWLLIVADGRTPAGMFRPPNDDPPYLAASEFDRTFFLCEPDRFFCVWP